MAHNQITVHFQLSGGDELDPLSMSSGDTVAHICEQLSSKLQAFGEVRPVVKLAFGGNVLWGIGKDGLHYHKTLGEWNISDGAVLDVILKKPPPTCARCDPDGAEVDVEGGVDDFPDRRLQCCRRRLCSGCFQELRGQCCPFEDCVEFNVTAYETSGSRSNWGGPANVTATGSSPELSAQGATEADDGAARSSGGSSLILFDLNGTLLFRPRQGASVAGAQSAVTEFPDGGYNKKTFRIYHRRGLSKLLEYLMQAPHLDWGFCTNQMAFNALPAIGAVLKESLGVEEVHRIEEARYSFQVEGVPQEIWVFDQAYCSDDPGGEVYETTGQPVQVFDIKTKVLAKVFDKRGRAPERTLVVAASQLKCSLCIEMWFRCEPFDEDAVCTSDEGGLADLLQRLVTELGV